MCPGNTAPAEHVTATSPMGYTATLAPIPQRPSVETFVRVVRIQSEDRHTVTDCASSTALQPSGSGSPRLREFHCSFTEFADTDFLILSETQGAVTTMVNCVGTPTALDPTSVATSIVLGTHASEFGFAYATEIYKCLIRFRFGMHASIKQLQSPKPLLLGMSFRSPVVRERLCELCNQFLKDIPLRQNGVVNEALVA